MKWKYLNLSPRQNTMAFGPIEDESTGKPVVFTLVHRVLLLASYYLLPDLPMKLSNHSLFLLTFAFHILTPRSSIWSYQIELNWASRQATLVAFSSSIVVLIQLLLSAIFAWLNRIANAFSGVRLRSCFNHFSKLFEWNELGGKATKLRASGGSFFVLRYKWAACP